MTSLSSDSLETGKVPWRRALWLLLTVLVLADLVSALESSMIYSAFKAIIQETRDPIGAGWLVSIYFVVAGPAAVVAGRLGDMYGRKRALICVLLLVASGSLISSLSPNMLGMIAGRGLQGVSGAIIPLCISILRESTTPQRFSFGLGVLLSAHAVGTMLGLLVGGLIVDTHHWRYVFTAAAFAAGVGLLGILLFAPASTGVRQKLDWLGLGMAPAVAALLFAISSFKAPTISGLQLAGIIAGALGLLAAWAWHELRQETPLVDLRALRDRNTAIANLIAVFMSMGPANISLYFSLLVQQPAWTGIGFGRSASAAGVIKSPMSLTSAFLAPVAGYSAGRWGAKAVLLFGATITTIGWSVLAFVPHIFWLFIAIMFLCSPGGMIINLGVTNMVASSAPHERTGEAQGLLAVSKSIGSAVGAQVIALLLSLSLVRSADGKEAFPDISAHTMTIVMLAGCSLACALLGLFSRRETGGGLVPSAKRKASPSVVGALPRTS